MRILFVFNHPAPYKVELLNRIATQLDITVIFERRFNHDRNRSFYDDNEFHFKHLFLNCIRLGKENALSFKIKRHLKKNHYDLIIMNGYSTLAEIIAINYMVKKNIPYALYVNGGVIRSDNKIKFHLKRFLISHAFRYYAPSHYVDDYLIHYGAKKENIRYYEYATISEKEIINTPLNEDEKKEVLTLYILPLSTPIFISVGQFIDRKNMMQLLELFLSRPQYHLLLVGGGQEEKKYRQFIKKHQMTNVTILPFLKRKELFSLLKATSAMIILSKEDIYGHVINEAFSQGIGVIASDKMVAAHTLIENGKNGYIVSLKDNSLILSMMDKILLLSCFDSATEVAKKNTYEKSAATHVKLWKEDK